MFQYSAEYIEQLLRGVYAGEIDRRNLPKSLYFAIAEHLKRGAYKGFGGGLPDFTPGGVDYELLAELRENVYMFSAAKTYQQVREMSDILVNEDKVRTFQDFKTEAMKVYDQYNTDWLKSEYNTAVAQGTMAVKWNEIQKAKDLLPLLRYSTIGDACPICEPMDDFTAKVDDPFWDAFYPPNHFNCLCTVTQHEADEEETPVDDAIQIAEGADALMQDVFKMNSGKDAVIFPPDSPYFTNIPKGDKGFARDNFGLPIPETDE